MDKLVRWYPILSGEKKNKKVMGDMDLTLVYKNTQGLMIVEWCKPFFFSLV